MISNEFELESPIRVETLPLISWFVGSYSLSKKMLDDLQDDESICWVVQFGENYTKNEFLFLWPEAERVDVDGVCWLIPPDIVSVEWCRENNAEVLEAVEIIFFSKKRRDLFIAQTDNPLDQVPCVVRPCALSGSL